MFNVILFDDQEGVEDDNGQKLVEKEMLLCIGLLKVIETTVRSSATSVAPLAGLVETTVGPWAAGSWIGIQITKEETKIIMPCARPLAPRTFLRPSFNMA